MSGKRSGNGEPQIALILGLYLLSQNGNVMFTALQILFVLFVRLTKTKEKSVR